MPATTPLASLKSSFSALSGNLTRQEHRFENVKGLPPTPASLANLEKLLASAEKSFSKMEEVFLEIAAMDPGSRDQYHTRLTTEADRYDALVQAVGEFIEASAPAAAPAAPVAAPPAPALGGQNLKVVHDLRPDKLSLDNTPAEFHLWTEAFRAYFSASKMDRLGAEDQHAFVFACLDFELYKRVRPSVLPTTSTFSTDGGDSVLGFIEAIFLQRYPLVQRRFEFFQYPHSTGQLASSWISDLRMRGDVADLDVLTVDELYAYRVITGVNDADLKDELLKLKSPTLKDVEEATHLYEAKLSTKARTSVNRVQGQVRGHPCNKSTNRRPGIQATPQRTSSSTSRCGRCNRANHEVHDCLFPASISCHRCGRQGHISPACRSVEARAIVEDGGQVEETHVSVRTLDSANESTPISVRVLESDPVLDYNPNQPTPRICLNFRQGSVTFSFLALPDSGATRTIVAQKLIERFGLSLIPCGETILAANGDRLRCAGNVILLASFGSGDEISINALVSPDIPSDILLAWHDMRQLNIIHEDFPLPLVRTVSSSLPLLNKLFHSYSDVVSDTLGSRCLDGPPMKIHLRTDTEVRPFKIYTTKQVPLHLQVEADAAVQRALDDGVICHETEPTDWCCRGGFVPKPNGKLRLITDFIPLNKFVLRPVHPFPSPLDIIQSVSPDSRVFAVLDCTMGYFQVPLDEASSKLTTFLLPQGRFRYKRAPMGLSASSDEFCRRSDEAINGLPGIKKLVDDILIQAPTVDALFQRLVTLLDRCRLHGLTLSKRKAQFSLAPGDPPVKFAGYLISGKGVEPDPDKTASLKAFPSPNNTTELRSFLGLANQLGFFIPDLAHLTARMRLLLKKGVAYSWNTDMDLDFSNIKKALTSSIIVRPFDPSLKTQLLTDASRVGLGFALLQIAKDGRSHLVQCGSRSLIPAETRYATIELECLAVVYAMSKCNFYLRGLDSFQLITDHRPLVGLFEKDLTDISNPRIQRFREKVAAYTFQVVWIAGKTNSIADALSRAPHFSPDDQAILCTVVAEDDARITEMETIATKDSGYIEVIEALLAGKRPSTLPSGHPAQSFSNVWGRLSVHRGILVLDSNRLVPPTSCRAEILRKLHLPHLGIVRTRKQAQQLYYWPGLNNEIKMMIQSCSVCQMLLPSQRPEPCIHTQARHPMEDVSIDLFEYGNIHYVLMADRYSGYLWVNKLMNQCTGGLIKILLDWYLEHGFPTNIRSDGGPQFRSEFDSFCNKFGITHDTSSPMYPEANGHAEANVKAAKYLLRKCLAAKEDYRFALLELRNTPRDDGFSPAQLYFARRQRTSLPCMPSHLSVPVDREAGRDAREDTFHRKQAQAESRTKSLSPLGRNQTVLVQDVKSKRWVERGKIISKMETGRSYRVRLFNGKVVWRNRIYLRPVGKFVLSAASSNHAGESSVASKEFEEPAMKNLRKLAPVNYRLARNYNKK